MSRSYATINLGPALKALNALEKKNLPFAEAMALNNAAFQAKADLITQMPKRFKGMRSSRPLKGYRVDKANKRQAIRESKVFHLDPWMTIHEAGGDKTPQKGTNLSVPMKEIQDKRTANGKINPRYWARNLLNQGSAPANARGAGTQGGRGRKRGNSKAFILNENGKRFIMKRKKGTDKPVPLYELKPKVRIPKRWDFHRTVKYSAKKHLPEMFSKAMAQALATTKAK